MLNMYILYLLFSRANTYIKYAYVIGMNDIHSTAHTYITEK